MRMIVNYFSCYQMSMASTKMFQSCVARWLKHLRPNSHNLLIFSDSIGIQQVSVHAAKTCLRNHYCKDGKGKSSAPTLLVTLRAVYRCPNFPTYHILSYHCALFQSSPIPVKRWHSCCGSWIAAELTSSSCWMRQVSFKCPALFWFSSFHKKFEFSVHKSQK